MDRAAGRADQLVLLKVKSVHKAADELLVPVGDGVDVNVEEQFEGGCPRQRGGEASRAEYIEGVHADVIADGGIAHLVQAAACLHRQPLRLLWPQPSSLPR